MRKYFALLLVLMLFVTGCSNDDAEPTQTTTPTETLPAGYYVENSELELKTNGAVRQYALPDKSYKMLAAVGDRLLLITDSDPSVLCLLSGEEGIPVAQLQMEGAMPDSSQALFNGFVYYDPASNRAVFLDPQLQQTQSIDLPAQMSDTPLFSPDGNRVFYCVGQEIRSIDAQKKFSRLIKTQNVTQQKLVGTCFNGQILICEAVDGEGNAKTQYISAENGQTLTTDNSLLSLDTYEERYLACRMDGTVRQWIVGTRNGEARQMNVTDDELVGALQLGGVVGYSTDENGLQLNYYDFETGKKTAAVTLPGASEPKALLADRWSGCIFLLLSDSAGDTLLRWDIKSSAVTDEAVYIGTLYTSENPDTVAIDAFSERISALNKKYGVRIRIWQEAVKTPGSHTLVAEHQTTTITDMLNQLEAVLAEFPKSFVSKSISNKVRICLVRSVDGEAKGVQYWSGSSAFIALSSGMDIRSEFLKAFGTVVDSHVLGNSPDYDYWDTLNPSGFVYGGTVDETLLNGESRAFVDAQSMSSATVDRSRIFWQAMLPENAEMFQSETMQNKLVMLCNAIRDAWNTKKSTEIFPWEQYLQEPIAYKKK